MEYIARINPIVISVRKRVNNTFGKGQHGARALYLAKWLSTRIPPTGRQATSIQAVGNKILSDIWVEVSMMLKGCEKTPPELKTLRQIDKIGSYQIMGGQIRVGTVILKVVTNQLKKRPFTYSYVRTLLPPGRSFKAKVKQLADWFYSKDQDTHNYLYYAHQDLLGTKENRPRNICLQLVAIPSFRTK